MGIEEKARRTHEKFKIVIFETSGYATKERLQLKVPHMKFLAMQSLIFFVLEPSNSRFIPFSKITRCCTVQR